MSDSRASTLPSAGEAIPEDVRARRLASLMSRRPNATDAERRFLEQLVSEGRSAPDDGHQYIMDPLTDEQIASIVVEADVSPRLARVVENRGSDAADRARALDGNSTRVRAVIASVGSRLRSMYSST